MKVDVLIKFLNDQATPEERRDVLEWLERPSSRAEFDALLAKQWEDEKIHGTDEDYKNILLKIHNRILQPERKQRFIFSPAFFRIAASFILVIFSGFFLFKMVFDSKVKRDEVLIAEVLRVIDRHTLIGEKLTLSMPDGSRITLNGESSIYFDEGYGKSNRTVRLIGEAFFDVFSDTTLPFEVITNQVFTRAIGTSFNVFSRDGHLRVALTSGRISVTDSMDSVMLSPGQLVALKSNGTEEGFSINQFNTLEVTGWKEGKLYFDRKKLSQILKDLETWYGVTIKIDPGVNSNQLVSGTFENKNLKDILTGLSFSTAFSFELHGKQVTIKK